jgi:RHS repeat-associated protein
MLIGRIDSDDELFQYFHDGLGSITMITDTTGSYQNLYVYDDFGNFRHKVENVTNSYCYTGQERDKEPSGLYNLRARYYAAGIGRFTQEDPVDYAFDQPQRMNLYTYVMNDPLNKLDPLGLYCISSGFATPSRWNKEEEVINDTGWFLTEAQISVEAQGGKGAPAFTIICVWYRIKTIIERQTRVWTDYEICFDHCGRFSGIQKKYSLETRERSKIVPTTEIRGKLQSFLIYKDPEWLCHNSWVLQP